MSIKGNLALVRGRSGTLRVEGGSYSSKVTVWADTVAASVSKHKNRKPAFLNMLSVLVLKVIRLLRLGYKLITNAKLIVIVAIKFTSPDQYQSYTARSQVKDKIYPLATICFSVVNDDARFDFIR